MFELKNGAGNGVEIHDVSRCVGRFQVVLIRIPIITQNTTTFGIFFWYQIHLFKKVNY